ncbi:MAG: DUF1722 domain-containing protein [Candidatus Omnitrophica bacterium]|nr:DUF1722 domain-containing protein [Candidatus Omnitrophota bacterium]
MEDKFPKPNIFSSKCLGFAKCRWNGEIIQEGFIDKLKPHVKFITTCPEYEIGLGIPRDPIRIVLKQNAYRLMQLNTERDLTERMNGFVSEYLASLKEIDGFILKDRSPSCGIKEVKVYPGLEPSSSIKKTSGFFGEGVLKRYPHAAVETEARLNNFTIRGHFLTKVFTSAKFRQVKAGQKMKDLVQFHAENKFLLMAYSQKELKVMGNIVANRSGKGMGELLESYELSLRKALDSMPKFTSAINVLTHALGYFSKKLASQEKRFFLNSLEEYRREQVPLSVPVNLIYSYIIRFKEEYLKQQTFFKPYPEDLSEVKDSGRGRSYR